MDVMRSLACFGQGLVLVACAACSGENASLAPDRGPGIGGVVTGAASAALDHSGHFQLPTSSGTEPPSISAAEAERLAPALAHASAALGGLPSAEAERGEPIQWSELRACRRTLYALSSWLPLDQTVLTSPYGAATQRAFGPHYVVSLCETGSDPSLTVAVSAYSTDLTVKGGDIVYPAIGGSWFQWRGTPRTQEAELRIGPERAVAVAARFTGRKITAVPALIIPDRRDGNVLDSRWSLSLDGPASLVTKSNRDVVSAQTVFVRWSKDGPTLEVEVSATNRDEPLDYRTALPKGPNDTNVPVAHGTLRRRNDFPARFETMASGDGLFR